MKITKAPFFNSFALALLSTSLTFSTLSNADTAATAKQAEPIATKVKIETSMGEITVQLFPKKAPVSVANFLKYVHEGYYDGTIFHRVIPSFMIQGGGFTKNFAQKITRAPIINEANNGLHNTVGTLAMARTNDPHSATSQFFINTVGNSFLDYSSSNHGYAVFGKVIDGMDTVKKIEFTPTGYKGGMRDVPKAEIIINSIKVLN